jgi:hypothetical protein
MEGELCQSVLGRLVRWGVAEFRAPAFSDCGEQSASHLFFAQTIDANHLVTRSLTVFQDDCALGNAQFFRQKPAQGSVRLSFNRWGSQLDLDRIAMFSQHLIDLRVWNDVNSNSRHCAIDILVFISQLTREPKSRHRKYAYGHHQTNNRHIIAYRSQHSF